MDYSVEIRGLTKKVRNKTIVDGLTFGIPKGEVFGFLGPNGAGKTTTIRMIVGLISITDGQVFIEGHDIKKDFEKAIHHVGAIVENPEMYKYLSGYQNLKMYARMVHGIDEARIREVVEFVGLQDRIHDKVKTYSLGMRQRLGLAQALLHKPSVLILDEPTNGLDPAGIRELRDHLRHLAQTEGVSVIVSSHLLSEMELMCDRVAIIQHGKLVDVRALREAPVDAAGSLQISMEVGTPQAAVKILESLDTVTDVTVDGTTAIKFLTERLYMPDIVRALVNQGIDVYQINTVAKSLEETFLEMTGGELHV